MTMRVDAKCPHCGAVCLCEWRFSMSPYMCVDHAGWFCLGCLRRIETTSMGQHFMADSVVYESCDDGSYLYNPFKPEEGTTRYMKFISHNLVGMPQDKAIVLTDHHINRIEWNNVIDVVPVSSSIDRRNSAD